MSFTIYYLTSFSFVTIDFWSSSFAPRNSLSKLNSSLGLASVRQNLNKFTSALAAPKVSYLPLIFTFYHFLILTFSLRGAVEYLPNISDGEHGEVVALFCFTYKGIHSFCHLVDDSL